MCAEADKEGKLFFLLTSAISLYTVPNDYLTPSRTLGMEFCYSIYDMFYNRQCMSVVMRCVHILSDTSPDILNQVTVVLTSSHFSYQQWICFAAHF